MSSSTSTRPLWLFNSANVFAGNPKWLFLHVAKHRPEIEAVWISSSKETTELIRGLGFSAVTFDSARGKQLQERASVYVVDQVKAHLPEPLKKATLLNLWHGVGVKAVERAPGVAWADWRIAEKYIRNNEAFRNNQLFLVSSPLMEEHFRSQLDLGEDDLVRGGYPQNVYQQVHEPFSSFDHDLKGRRGLPSTTRIALYAPTWRRGPAAGFLHHALPDVPRLLEVLEQEDLLFVVKMHPKLVNDPVFLKMRQRYAAEPRLLFWDPAEDVYEMHGSIDIGVVDYSSIHYDMLAAGVRRFVRYAFDLAAFEENVRPGLSYEELSCGTMATSFEELLAALRDPRPADDATVDRLLDTFWAYSSPETLDVLVDRALAFRHRDVPLKTLYSFDVFDTVIHRRGVEPQSVFHYVAQKMAASDLAYPEDLQRRFPAVRSEAEISARNYYRRQEARVLSGELEIGFDDIYDRIADLYQLVPEQVEALKAWEIEGEVLSAIPDPGNVKRIKELVARGETVVLISDMYLPNAVLKRILAAADPVLAELPLYLSNDHGVQKTTKRLYLKVYEDLRYDFREWIHTGDNLHADIKQASQMGITTRQCVKPELTGYPGDLAAYGNTFDAYLVGAMMREHDEDRSVSAVERFAYSYVAPYFVPYISWVIGDAIERGTRTLYFISRDGHHLKRIADALIEERGLDLRTHYLYGSRQAWRIASQIDELDEDIFRIHGNFSGVKTPEALLAAARLDAPTFAELFPEFEDVLFSDSFDTKLVRSILQAMKASARFHEHLLAVAAEARPLVTQYLRQEIDPDETYAFVEYWGRGYTQDCLTRLMDAAFGPGTGTRMYYARSIYPTMGESVRYHFTAASYNFLAAEAIFANLPYGTTEGYELRDGRVEPVFSPRPHDPALHAALERELPRFAREYGRQPFVDQEGIDRDVFRFAFSYYGSNPEDPSFAKHLAPLKDAAQLGDVEREYAPAFTIASLAKLLLWRDSIARYTRSPEMSLVRSSPIVQLAYHVGRHESTIAARRVLRRSRSLTRALNRMLVASRG